jgi:hypothetical protein
MIDMEPSSCGLPNGPVTRNGPALWNSSSRACRPGSAAAPWSARRRRTRRTTRTSPPTSGRWAGCQRCTRGELGGGLRRQGGWSVRGVPRRHGPGPGRWAESAFGPQWLTAPDSAFSPLRFRTEQRVAPHWFRALIADSSGRCSVPGPVVLGVLRPGAQTAGVRWARTGSWPCAVRWPVFGGRERIAHERCRGGYPAR